MTDLSKVLGDLYTAPVPASSEGPEWADDAHLDEAFAAWEPGPPASAPAMERALSSSAVAEPVSMPASVSVLPSHDSLEMPADHDTPAARMAAGAPILRWHRGDDDILPARATRRSMRRAG